MSTRPPNAFPSRATQFASACLLGLLCGGPSLAATRLSSVVEFNAGKARAEAELRADRTACDKLFGNARDICREQARGRERVAKAQLALAHLGTRSAQDRLTTIRMDATYDLARTRCNDLTGSAKNDCAKEAHAVRAKAMADLQRRQRVADASRDAEVKPADELTSSACRSPRR